MGFIGVDQGIYTIALLGMLAGVVGTVKAGKEILLDGKSAAWLPFVTLTIGSTWVPPQDCNKPMNEFKFLRDNLELNMEQA